MSRNYGFREQIRRGQNKQPQKPMESLAYFKNFAQFCRSLNSVLVGRVGLLVLTTVVAIVVILIKISADPSTDRVVKSVSVRENLHPGPGCDNVLQTMLDGHWEPRPSTPEERQELQRQMAQARALFNVGPSVQRQDGKCGNVSLANNTGLRGQCDPEGPTPCCYDNQCVQKTVLECQCDNCFDFRQKIRAELSQWVPNDPQCQTIRFHNATDTCELLRNMTIYLIGDSFLRHVFVSLMKLLRSEASYGPLIRRSKKADIQDCQDIRLYTSICKWKISRQAKECNKTVHMKFLEFWWVTSAKKTLKVINSLRKKPNSLVVLGIGVHENFNHGRVIDKFLRPLLQNISGAPWPKMLWSAGQPPGLLKPPRYPHQSRANVLNYNLNLEPVLVQYGVPIYNTFYLTEKAESFDGTHFGSGVNDVKAQILLNYIWELRATSNRTGFHIDLHKAAV